MPKISSIYPMGNGTYRAAVSLGFDVQTGKRIQKFKNGFKTQKEAQEWRLRMLADFGKGSITVNSTMTFKKFLDDYFIPDYKSQKEWYITDTKSISGVRLLYLDDDTLEHLKYWKKAQSQIGECKFVFSIVDSPLVKSTLKRVLKSHSDYAKIKSIRIHDLRHSHASFMLSLGMNDLEMQNRLGHADIKTTLGTYSHLRPNAMKEVATRMTGKVIVSDNNIRKSNFNGNQHTKNFQSKVLSD